MQSEAAPGLVDVSGIGDADAGVLVAVGVNDAAELAREDVEDLARRLADAGHPHPAQRLRSWIAEARRVTEVSAEAAREQSAPPTADVDEPAGSSAEAARARTLVPDEEAGQLAAFTVFFEGDAAGERTRVRIYHEESGEQRTIDGIDPAALLRFMLVDAPSSTTDPVPAALLEAAGAVSIQPAQPDVARSVDGVEVSVVDVAVGSV